MADKHADARLNRIQISTVVQEKEEKIVKINKKFIKNRIFYNILLENHWQISYNTGVIIIYPLV